VIFVHDYYEWERGRKRIIEQLTRYGFRQNDRMCVSVAVDEVLLIALERIKTGTCKSAAIAYFINSNVIHVRIRFMGGAAPDFFPGREHSPWLLAAACMSGVRSNEDQTEIEMWKENTVAGAASTRS
jgi:hypothetical protein